MWSTFFQDFLTLFRHFPATMLYVEPTRPVHCIKNEEPEVLDETTISTQTILSQDFGRVLNFREAFKVTNNTILYFVNSLPEIQEVDINISFHIIGNTYATVLLLALPSNDEIFSPFVDNCTYYRVSDIYSLETKFCVKYGYKIRNNIIILSKEHLQLFKSHRQAAYWHQQINIVRNEYGL
jgi:hypothetical protein